MKHSLFFAAFAFLFSAAFVSPPRGHQPLPKLSDYGFFEGPLAALQPSADVIPYALNTPLFSNYAEKARFIKVPRGITVPYNDSIAFDFPDGTVLIKNFYYPNDFRYPAKGRQLLETRLLVKTAGVWEAFPYVWNAEQTEAFYEVAGELREVIYVDAKGKKNKISYLVPNKNQCKGCHARSGQMVPLGPTARNLNGDFDYGNTTENQLQHWQKLRLLANLPGAAPKLPVFTDVTASIESRARAYLDVNCGNCHHRLGPASTSGLFLDWSEQDVARLGVRKPPVAAGRGAGNFPFDIVPGHPDQSILVYRMKTTDPGIAMPEIGREQIHKEGVALIEAWIKNMK